MLALRDTNFLRIRNFPAIEVQCSDIIYSLFTDIALQHPGADPMLLEEE